jgi:superfamily II DNA or RNA helicase
MQLKDAIQDFTDTKVAITSGRKILETYIKPLLEKSSFYYKISSFFSPNTIENILLQLDTCFRKKERVKLVIGVHDSAKLIPVLEEIQNPNRNEKLKIAVQNIIYTGIEECLASMEKPTDFLHVFAELVKQDLIQIKIASVKKDYLAYLNSGNWPENDSTFHPKVSIFKDSVDTVIMSGSINSTNKGYGDNVEEASFIGSWFSPSSVAYYENTFNDIWNGNHEESYTLDFNNEIKSVVDSIVKTSRSLKQASIVQTNFSYLQLTRLINDSPLFFHYSFKHIRLLPHQIGVYRLVLSRWPIIGLIADEVGLGKTVEAGAVIKYLKRFFSINRTALLVPSSLRNQWQAEMYNLFGLEFYIYDSNTRSLVFAPNNEVLHIIPNVSRGNYFEHNVVNIIFSWHYLRSADGLNYKLDGNDEIDLVIVDEAHGARLSGDNNEELESTLLYQFLEQLLPAVPHKLLLTATPYQTNSLDYLALLRLLMGNSNLDAASLQRIAVLNSNRPLVVQQKMDAILELVNTDSYQTTCLPTDIDKLNFGDLFELYEDSMYIQNHPTTIYTLRNTRDKLKSIGYRFPSVEIESQAIELSKGQRNIFRLAQSYIENNLFAFESSVGIIGTNFARIIYHQRIVSSIKACYDTLLNRLAKLENCISSGFIEDGTINTDGDDDSQEEISIIERVPLSDSQISIAETELSFIKELLTRIENKLIVNNEISDPKIEKALAIVDKHIRQGDKVILFSRFTSTTDYIVEKMVAINQYNIGRYQGNLKQFIKNHIAFNVDRQAISRMFTAGDFPVIVCSDAASEGLNLQTANVVINVDVPWNPARLLQRFGRIDRFGQKKEQIFFYNLFYPETVEDRMYARLHRRNTEFREILGTTPDITSESHIRDLQFREFADAGNSSSFSYKNSLIDLSAKDNIRIHERILARLDSVLGVFRDATSINYNDQLFRYSCDEMDEEYLDLNHELFKKLKVKIIDSNSFLHELRNGENCLILYGVMKEELFYPFLSIDEMLDYLLCAKPFKRDKTSSYIHKNSLSEGLSVILSNSEFNFINPLRTLFANSNFDFYNGLKLEKTNIKVSCSFV